MGRWLAFAQLAAAAVVDVGVPAGYVRVRIDIAGVLHELDVARDASPADVAALARTFCDGRRELIAEAVGGIADWAVASGCPELVAAAAARELAPDLAFTDASVFVATPEAVATDLELVTVATAPAPGLYRLLASVATHAHDVVPRVSVLGLGLGFAGTIQKLAWTREWLRTVPGDRVVLFVDAYDTVLQRPIVAADALLPPGAVLFGADRRCEPDVCAGPLAPGRYLNAGGYVGRAADVLRLLDGALRARDPPATASDQATLSAYALGAATGARLDVDGRVHAPLDGAAPSDYAFADGAWRDAAGRAPLVLHGNRGGKDLLAAMVDRLDAADLGDLPARLRAFAAP